jgi:DNA primase
VLLLRRFAPRVVVVYDSDAAGMLASERGLHLFEEAELPVRVAALSPGRDPDSFLRREGTEEFRTFIEKSLSMFDFHVAQALGRHDTRTLEGRVALADELLPVIGSVANPVRQSEYLRALAERFGFSEDALRRRLAARSRPTRGAAGEPGPSPVPATKKRREAERFLVRMMVQVPEARKVIRRDLSVQDFLDPLHHTLAQVLMGEDVPAETLRERLAGTESVELLMQLLFEPIGAEEKDKEKVLAEYVRFLQRLVPAEEERRRLSRAIEEAQLRGMRRRHLAELLLDLLDGAEEVGPHAVELVNETNTRNLKVVGLMPHGFRLRFNSGNAVEHDHAAIQHP